MSNITHPAVSEQLLVRIAAGDKAALAELYAQAKNPVYCFALSILRDSFAAEDVMQETFLQVWKSAPTYRPSGKNALTWILGITKYTALARLREGQRAGIPLEDAADKVDPRDAFRDCENRIVPQAMLDNSLSCRWGALSARSSFCTSARDSSTVRSRSCWKCRCRRY